MSRPRPPTHADKAPPTKGEIRARIISGGRLTIPKKFRKELGLEVGDFVIIRVERGQILVIPARFVERRGGD